MRHALWNSALVLALGAAFTACDLTQLKKTDEETAQPATEATVVGVWRTNVPNTATNPPSDIKVTMQVDAGHTMLMSYRVATGMPSPNDFVEISKEYWTWSVADGKMTCQKTTCEYTDPATMEKTTTCAEPTARTKDINVKGTAWTVVEDGQPIVFRKD